MDVYEIRRDNLRQLAAEVGGISAIADRLGKSQSQLSQVIGVRPRKQIGARIARQVEVTFGWPPGWLDQVQPLGNPLPDQVATLAVTGDELESIHQYRQLAPDTKRQVQAVVAAFVTAAAVEADNRRAER